MTLSPEQIRGLCTGEVFDRAVDYREDDRVERVGRFGDTVQGSQADPYEVEIEAVSGDPAELDATCACPYDWGGYCKHIIAVLLELSEGNLEDEREVVERVSSDAIPRNSGSSCSKSAGATRVSADGSSRGSRSSGLTILSEYRADVSVYDPRTYFEVYKERLEPFLAETTGRKHYRTVIEYLEEMRELGFEEEFEAFVARLKEKHSNRPAFLDEMETLDVEGG